MLEEELKTVVQREMYAKQNTFGCCDFFLFFLFVSDPPAVIVIAEVILQDVCKRRDAPLHLGFHSFLFKCLIYMLVL